MTRKVGRHRLVRAAADDYRAILQWTLNRFGRQQFDIYRVLLDQAIDIIAADPHRVGTRERGELGAGIRTFHVNLVASRKDAARHVIVYRIAPDDVIDVLRILHESMELRRHIRSAG